MSFFPFTIKGTIQTETVDDAIGILTLTLEDNCKIQHISVGDTEVTISK